MQEPETDKERGSLIQTARGLCCADILFSNAEIFNSFTGEWQHTSFSVKDGMEERIIWGLPDDGDLSCSNGSPLVGKTDKVYPGVPATDIDCAF